MIKIIKIPKNIKIAVIGDIHEHQQQFNDLIEKLQPSDKLWIVSVGDIYDKGFGPEKAEAICEVLKQLNEQGIGYAIQGNHELKLIRKYRKEKKALPPGLAWCSALPLALFFEFTNNSKLTVVHGGVTPRHTWDDMGINVETCYVRAVDEKGKMIRLVWVTENGIPVLKLEKPNGTVWHEIYDGRFGYIASGHAAQKDGVAKFYNYSCNLDTSCYSTGILTAQIFSETGREELISVTGLAANPVLNIIE